jgi:hypothetical protein
MPEDRLRELVRLAQLGRLGTPRHLGQQLRQGQLLEEQERLLEEQDALECLGLGTGQAVEEAQPVPPQHRRRLGHLPPFSGILDWLESQLALHTQ